MAIINESIGENVMTNLENPEDRAIRGSFIDTELQESHATLQALEAEVGRVVVIDDEKLEAVIGGVVLGRLLLTGSFGTGKTEIAKAIAGAINGTYGHVQGTSDLMPSDVLGKAIYNPATRQMEFAKGPIFSEVFFFDEGNRATPKTKSAMLEAANSGEVTPAGINETYKLPASQVQIEARNDFDIEEGTYPTPQADDDRKKVGVLMTLTKEQKHEIAGRRAYGTPEVKAVVESPSRIGQIRENLGRISVSRDLTSAIVEFGEALASDEKLEQGQLAGARHINDMIDLSRVHALARGSLKINKEDVQFAAKYTLPHRIRTTYDAQNNGVSAMDIVKDKLNLIS